MTPPMRPTPPTLLLACLFLAGCGGGTAVPLAADAAADSSAAVDGAAADGGADAPGADAPTDLAALDLAPTDAACAAGGQS